MGGMVSSLVQTVAKPFETMGAGLANAMEGMFTGNFGQMGRGVAGAIDAPTWMGPNAANYVNGGNWGPTPGTPTPSGFGASPSSVPSLTGSPPTTAASSGPAIAPGSTGSATQPSAMSPSMKSAISGSITSQLPGLVSADEATGMNGVSPAFLSSQAGEASGFTNQQTLIQQAVQNWLAQNPQSGGF